MLSELEKVMANLNGAWVLQSSEMGGKVYKQPEISGLMVFTEQHWFIHAANPDFAVSETGKSELVGSKIIGSIDSHIWVNFPPGAGTPVLSTDPMAYEAGVSIDDGKISFEPLPGQKWIVEEDKITVGTPGVFLDTWTRLESSQTKSAGTSSDKLLRGTFVVESMVLNHGTVRKPPEIKGLFIT